MKDSNPIEDRVNAEIAPTTRPSHFPEFGFVRLPQILGDPKADPPVPAVIPVSRSTWWNGVKTGRYPKPVKLSPRTTAWRVEDILSVVAELAGKETGK